MSEPKICRICMGKDNLTSVWGRADGEKINDKIHFLCGIIVTVSDSLPKFICHMCLSQLIIGACIKRKSLETEKILNELLEDEIVEEVQDNEEEHDDPFYSEPREPRNKFLVYEENTEDEDQPKINYELTEDTVRMKSTKHIENPDLKSFLDGYLAARPNMEIIKVSNPENIKEIEKVIDANNEIKRLRAKRPRSEMVISSIHSNLGFNTRQQKPQKEIFQSRLLSALAGQRIGNINISRMSSPLFNSNNANRNN